MRKIRARGARQAMGAIMIAIDAIPGAALLVAAVAIVLWARVQP